MSAQDEHRQRLHLSQFAGFPIYFFDMGALLKLASSLGDWNEGTLATTVATCLAATVGKSDVKIAGDCGFTLIFTNRTASLAGDRAQAICSAIVERLSLQRKLTPEETDRFCRPRSLKDLAVELGISPASPRAFVRPGSKPSRPVTQGRLDGEGEQFAEELNALFVDHLLSGAEEHDNVLYSPIWDSKKGRITAFGLGLGGIHRRRMEGPRVAADALMLASAQSKLDIAVLAWALRGARRILSRGPIALISAPVHVETLSWSKTRNAYLDVLSQIEPSLLALVTPRIVGLDAGSNLSQVTQWSRALHQHVRGLFVHLPSTNFDFSRTGVLGVTGFGLSVPVNRAALAEEAGKLSRICAEQNAVAHVDNVASAAELSLLKRKGIRFISGPLIGAPMPLARACGSPAFARPHAAVSA